MSTLEANAGRSLKEPAVPEQVFGAPPAVNWPAVPGYQIVAELGRGSTGVVYKAWNLQLNRLVALKVLRKPTGVSDEMLARCAEEARLVATLRHANLIQLFDIHLQDHMPFVAMELADGGSLAAWINGKPQPIHQSAAWIETLARAVDIAHQRGIVHRDLKPANILLQGIGARSREAMVRSQESGVTGQEGGEEGEIMSDVLVLPADPDAVDPVLKISDFAFVGQPGDGADNGMIAGTPSYMAPEQAEGNLGQIGPATDVYALGAILYEMLTGRPPYAGESPLDTVLQIFQIEPVPPSRLQSKVPPDLEMICLKCLAKDQARRYASGGALADDLRRFLAGEPIQARPVALPARVWQWARRRPGATSVIAGILGAVLALLGIAAWHQLDRHARVTQARLDAEATALRAAVSDLIQAGATAVQAKEWDKGRGYLEHARDLAAKRPDLADLREPIDALLAQADARNVLPRKSSP